MSALSKLVGKPQPWHWFSGKYPVKTKQVNPPASFTKTIKENILEAGDALQGRTAAKCLMTKWNMHDEYKTFRMVGEEAIEVANFVVFLCSDSNSFMTGQNLVIDGGYTNV